MCLNICQFLAPGQRTTEGTGKEGCHSEFNRVQLRLYLLYSWIVAIFQSEDASRSLNVSLMIQNHKNSVNLSSKDNSSTSDVMGSDSDSSSSSSGSD